MWHLAEGSLRHSGPVEVSLTARIDQPVADASLPGVDFVLHEWAPDTIHASAPITAVLGENARELPGVPSARTIRFENQIGTAHIVVETDEGLTAPLRPARRASTPRVIAA